MSSNRVTGRIPRATYASQVTERLRQSIIDREIEPGAQLGEVELATSFGVSRGPVREALQRLVQEGLVRSEPHRGVFVPVLSDEDVVDVYLARDALESAAVRRVIASGRAGRAADVLDSLVRAMTGAERAGDWAAVSEHDLEFHTALVQASGSSRLMRMFSTVMSETRLCLGALTEYPQRDDLVDEHRLISAHIRDGDVGGALSTLRKHYEDAIETLREHGRTDPGTDQERE